MTEGDATRPSDHMDAPAPAPQSKVQQPRLGFVGLRAVLLASAHEHAHRAVAAAAARDRGDPGLARAAAHLRPERRHRSTAPNNPDTAPVLDSFQVFNIYTSVWFSAIYLLAVHLADRLRDPAHQAPLRGAARPPAEDSRATLAPGGLHDAHAPRRMPTTRSTPLADCCARSATASSSTATRSAPSAATSARPATSSSTPRSSACWSRSASAVASATPASA